VVDLGIPMGLAHVMSLDDQPIADVCLHVVLLSPGDRLTMRGTAAGH
jgi:hypothetical protein